MAELAAFFILAIIFSVTPGPDSVLVLRNAVRNGRRHGTATALGAVCGGLFWGLAAAVGVAALLAQSATLYQVIKIAGAAYLILLGAQTLIAHWRGRGSPIIPSATEAAAPAPATTPSPAPALAGSRRRAFLVGLTCDLLNPKMGLFYMAVLPQFIPAEAPFLPYALLLCAIESAVAIAWLYAIVYLAHAAMEFLRRPAVGKWLERILGGTLVGLGTTVALEH